MLFRSAEIKDIVSYLRLVANGDDDPAFIRAVTTPKRGVGQSTLEALGAFAGQWQCSLFEAVFKGGIESKLAIAWLVAFFPIVVDTAAGLRSTPRELLELARSLRAAVMSGSYHAPESLVQIGELSVPGGRIAVVLHLKYDKICIRSEEPPCRRSNG